MSTFAQPISRNISGRRRLFSTGKEWQYLKCLREMSISSKRFWTIILENIYYYKILKVPNNIIFSLHLQFFIEYWKFNPSKSKPFRNLLSNHSKNCFGSCSMQIGWESIRFIPVQSAISKKFEWMRTKSTIRMNPKSEWFGLIFNQFTCNEIQNVFELDWFGIALIRWDKIQSKTFTQAIKMIVHWNGPTLVSVCFCCPDILFLYWKFQYESPQETHIRLHMESWKVNIHVGSFNDVKEQCRHTGSYVWRKFLPGERNGNARGTSGGFTYGHMRYVPRSPHKLTTLLKKTVRTW